MTGYMKSNSTTALTLYPFLRQIKMRLSTAAGVTSGIDATGLPCIDQPRSTVALGMRLRAMGALSRRIKGARGARIVAFAVRQYVYRQSEQGAAKVSTLVKYSQAGGCQIPKTYLGVK